MKKSFIVALSFIALLGITSSQVMAHSTIYTDDLGRLHFLGKDPGAKTLQKIEDYDNPYTKDVTNATYSSSNVKNDVANETKVKATNVQKKMDNSAENLSKKRFWQIW